MKNNQIKNENNELKDYTIKSLPDNLSVLDPDGTIIYVNNLWKKFAYDNGINPNLCSQLLTAKAVSLSFHLLTNRS